MKEKLVEFIRDRNCDWSILPRNGEEFLISDLIALSSFYLGEDFCSYINEIEEEKITFENSDFYIKIEIDREWGDSYFQIFISVNENNVKEVISEFNLIKKIDNISSLFRLSKIVEKLPLEFL